MTEKMQMMKMIVLKVILDSFEDDYLDYVAFSGGVGLEDFADYVLMEYIKYAYIEQQEKHPLRYYIPYTAEGDNSIRMQYQRVRNYIQKYRDREYEQMLKMDHHNDEKLEQLKPKPMDNIENRLEGAEMTPMEFYEATQIHDMAFVKAIVEHRIMDTKKVSNSAFKDMLKEYDSWIEGLSVMEGKADEQIVMDSVAFFTIEWKYAIELMYAIVLQMEAEGIEEVDRDIYSILCARMTIQSKLGFNAGIDSRLVKERQNLVDMLITRDPGMNYILMDNMESYAEVLTIACLMNEKITIDGEKNLRDWFAEETTMEDWASFLKEYNIFEAWHKKEFDNNRIRKLRKLFGQIFIQ